MIGCQKDNHEEFAHIDAGIRQARFVKEKDLPECQPITDLAEKVLLIEKTLI